MVADDDGGRRRRTAMAAADGGQWQTTTALGVLDWQEMRLVLGGHGGNGAYRLLLLRGLL